MKCKIPIARTEEGLAGIGRIQPWDGDANPIKELPRSRDGEPFHQIQNTRCKGLIRFESSISPTHVNLSIRINMRLRVDIRQVVW
jgi:hypothetical protein